MLRSLLFSCSLLASVNAYSQEGHERGDTGTQPGGNTAADPAWGNSTGAAVGSEHESAPSNPDEAPAGRLSGMSSGQRPMDLSKEAFAIEARLKVIREKIRRRLATQTDGQGRHLFARAWQEAATVCKKSHGVGSPRLRTPAQAQADSQLRLSLKTHLGIMGAIRGLSKTPDPSLGGFSEYDLLALTSTAFGEARSLANQKTWDDLRGRANMVLVMKSLNDRRLARHRNLSTVGDQALSEAQFSCWNRNDVNLACLVVGPMPELDQDRIAHQRAALAFVDFINPGTRIFYGEPPKEGKVSDKPFFLYYVTDKLRAGYGKTSSNTKWWIGMRTAEKIGVYLPDGSGQWKYVFADPDQPSPFESPRRGIPKAKLDKMSATRHKFFPQNEGSQL